MRILTFALGLLAIAGAAYTQEKGDSKSTIPEEALEYLEPARIALIEALSQSGAHASDITNDLDTVYVCFPSLGKSLFDPPSSFFDSIRFECVTFLPWSWNLSGREGNHARIEYHKLSTSDSVMITVWWRYGSVEKIRVKGIWITPPSNHAATATFVYQERMWKLIKWKIFPLM